MTIIYLVKIIDFSFDIGNSSTVVALAGNKSDLLETRQVQIEVCFPSSRPPSGFICDVAMLSFHYPTLQR